MKLNVGTTDRIIRAVLGIVLITLSLAGSAAVWALLVGLILLGTAAFSFCPVYALFGKSTCAMPPPGSKAGAQ